MRAFLAVLLAGLLAGCSSPPSEDDGDGSGAEQALDSATYAITLAGVPTLPVAQGQPFHFNSTVSGGPTHTSDHIGAHFGNASTTEPSTAAYNVSCVHQQGDLPGKYEVTCTAPAKAGVYYLRGHARITEGETVVNWWSAETSFTVA